MKQAAALLVLLAACSRPAGQAWVGAGGTGADFQESEVMAVITGALMGEAAGAATDSLYIRERFAVVNGRTRTVPPFFAGVSPGGEVVITSSQVEIRASSSWSVVDYRWVSRDGPAQEGRATLVLTLVAPRTWRIQHVHSSAP